MKRRNDELSQPCWTCEHAFGGCSWSSEFVPVEGWKAIPVTIPYNETCADTYKILYCPKYAPDRRTRKQK